MTLPLSAAGGDIARRLDRMASALERADRDTVAAALDRDRQVHESVMLRDTHDMRMSGVGRRGARVAVRVRVTGDGVGTVEAVGPVHLLERPTKPHMIPRQSTRRRRRRVVVIPGVGPRAWARHPGTPGMRTWSRGQREAQPVIAAEMRRRTSRVLRAAM